MTRVTRKALIITREQYKKMCRSVELSKGIVSSYLVKFQMTFHMTANQKQSFPRVNYSSSGGGGGGGSSLVESLC